MDRFENFQMHKHILSLYEMHDISLIVGCVMTSSVVTADLVNFLVIIVYSGVLVVSSCLH